MTVDPRLLSDRFPRSSKYNPEWIMAAVSGGAHSLWLTEWLTSALDLRPGMRVLDLGCGRAASSIFLHREFGVEVWATDLWFDASENLQRIRDAGVEKGVFPIHADARSLPFATEFFDAVISIDSFVYYGTDDLYLRYLARFLRPGGTVGIAGAGLMQEIGDQVPDHLREWWEPSMCCLHSAPWWRRHWERSGAVIVDVADHMPDGVSAWLAWQQTVCPENSAEIKALEADAGRYLGYVRVVARRRTDVELEEPIISIPSQFVKKILLRAADSIAQYQIP
jgi:cyclopropane fatty-acyl-phospholipid synthase-like methyltransferase